MPGMTFRAVSSLVGVDPDPDPEPEPEPEPPEEPEVLTTTMSEVAVSWPLAPAMVAMTLVVPGVTPVAKPLELMVATPGMAVDQVT